MLLIIIIIIIIIIYLFKHVRKIFLYALQWFKKSVCLIKSHFEIYEWHCIR